MNITGAEYETRVYEVERKRPTWLPVKPRFINMLYAHLFAYFWLPCHICGKKSGGHEWDGQGNGGVGTCWKHKTITASVPTVYYMESDNE